MHLTMSNSSELLKGTLSTIILRLLECHGRMYGYELTLKVKELTQGRILLKEGSLYPALHRLEADSMVVSEVEMIGKRTRKYYQLTLKGSSSVGQAVSELQEFLSTLDALITADPRHGIAH